MLNAVSACHCHAASTTETLTHNVLPDQAMALVRRVPGSLHCPLFSVITRQLQVPGRVRHCTAIHTHTHTHTSPKIKMISKIRELYKKQEFMVIVLLNNKVFSVRKLP